MVSFALDMLEIPEKVEAVMDEIVPHISYPVCQHARKQGYPAVWVGGWRSAPAMLSPKMWGQFVWPYFRRLVLEAVEQGLIPILHLDASGETVEYMPPTATGIHNFGCWQLSVFAL